MKTSRNNFFILFLLINIYIMKNSYLVNHDILYRIKDIQIWIT